MNIRRRRQVFIISVCATLFGCSDESRWLEVGIGREDQDCQYRLIDLKLPNGKIIERTHAQMAGLQLDAQSGRARGKWALVPVTSCASPSIRDGQASIRCRTNANGDIFVSAADNVRELLLNIERLGKIASVKGLVIGNYVDTPMLYVNDPLAKANSK